MSMMITPGRFGIPSAPSAWESVHDASFTTQTQNWNNATIRVHFSRGLLPAAATKIRITFGTGTVRGLKVSKVTVGASRSLVYDVAPTEVLFGGVSGFSIATTSAILLSDEINFAYDGLSDLCVSFHVATDAISSSLDSVAERSVTSGLISYDYQGGDLTTSTGGTWSRTGKILGIRKFEIYTGGAWKNIFRAHTGYPTNWNNYTLRNLIAPDQFTRARNTVRFGFAYRINEAFVGNSAGGASPFDFYTTPIRLTFGGNNGTPGTEDYITHFTDDFDYTQLDLTKDLLVSVHTATSRIAERSSPPTGQSSRYKSGNSVSTVTWQSGSSGWNTLLGPQHIDEEY